MYLSGNRIIMQEFYQGTDDLADPNPPPRVMVSAHTLDSQANHFHDMMNGKARTREARRASNWKYYKDMMGIINAHSTGIN